MLITCNGAKCIVTEVEIMASGAINYYTAKFTFNSLWNDFISANAIYGVFKGSGNLIFADLTYNSETGTYDCDIPWETITSPGELLVGAFGHISSPENIVLTTNMAFGYQIPLGAYSEVEGQQSSSYFLALLSSINQSVSDAENAATTAETAADRAENALAHWPYIDESTNNWFIWDVINEEYIDTEVNATGPQGEQGIQGIQGIQGVGISSIDRTSGDGSPGTIDTYTITFTDTSTSYFTIYNGENGVNSYVHIKYSAINPTDNGDLTDIPSAWVGIYTGSSETAPINYTDYSWYNWKGITGDPGADGEDGAPGSIWHFDSGIPGVETGINGDYYLDTNLYDIYFKSSDIWNWIGNIKGNIGDPGSVWYNGIGNPNPSSGIIGDYYLDISNGDIYKKTDISTWTPTANIKGATGDTGLAGSKWYYGTDVPDSGIGVDTDYYLNTSNGDVYNKSSSTWSLIGNIKGADGSDGVDGVDGYSGSIWYSDSGVAPSEWGVDGDYYLDLSNGDVYKKNSGSWAIVGNIKGINGTDGTDGTDGSKWYFGSEDPSSGTGIDGDYYLNTSTYDIFNKISGTWGSAIGNIKGADGSSGSSGSSVTGIYSAEDPPDSLTAIAADGITDDTTTLQAILDWVGQNGGGTIVLPSGTILANIVMNYPNVTLSGTGACITSPGDGGTCIRPYTPSSDCITIGSTSSTPRLWNVNIKDLSIVYNTTTAADGLVIDGVHFCTINNVYIFGFINNIYMTSTYQSTSFINISNAFLQFADEALVKCVYTQDSGNSNLWTTAIYMEQVGGTGDTGAGVLSLEDTTIHMSDCYFDYDGYAVDIIGNGKIKGSNTIFDGPNDSVAAYTTKNSTDHWEFREGRVIFNPGTTLECADTNEVPLGTINDDTVGSVFDHPILYYPYIINELQLSDNNSRKITIGETTLNFWNEVGLSTIRPYNNLSIIDTNSSSDNTQVKIQNQHGYIAIENDYGDLNLVSEGGSIWLNALTNLEGTYNGSHLVIGSIHLWYDGSGNLRYKASAPSSAIDGSVLYSTQKYINVKDYGALGDGSTDDTAAFNTATAYANSSGINHVYVPKGTYMIQGYAYDPGMTNYLHDYGGIKIYDNMIFEMNPEAILKQITTDQRAYQIIRIYDKQNVIIRGGQLYGDRDTHTGATGENGYGISIQGGKNIMIQDVSSYNMWGDGINIQVIWDGDVTFEIPEDIVIERVNCYNNRRQGMSVEAGIHVIVKDSKFTDTNGTAPQAGIDIEPWTDVIGTYHVDGIVIENCILSGNLGCGLVVDSASIRNVVIKDCTLIENQNVMGQFMVNDGINVTIQNCYFENYSTYYCIELLGGYGHNIINNEFHCTGLGAVRLRPGTQYSTIYDFNISKNRIYDSVLNTPYVLNLASNCLKGKINENIIEHTSLSIGPSGFGIYIVKQKI
jgi:hypothetical protein